MISSTATSPETATTEHHGGTIIPFPVRERAAPAPAAPADDRLGRALANLTAALEEQRAAVTAWRSVMGELKASTSGLRDSLQRYSANLETLGESVSTLRDRARSLEQWADGAMAAQD